MNTQAHLFGEQLTFSSFIQPAPTAETQQVTEERDTETQRGTKEEIENKQERISELLKEIGGSEEVISILNRGKMSSTAKVPGVSKRNRDIYVVKTKSK